MSDAPVEIQRMLVLSTAHLRAATCNNYLPFSAPFVAYPKGDYGFFVPVSDDWVPNSEVPNELVLIIDYAREHNCTWIMFDQDGPEQPGLVTYEW